MIRTGCGGYLTFALTFQGAEFRDQQVRLSSLKGSRASKVILEFLEQREPQGLRELLVPMGQLVRPYLCSESAVTMNLGLRQLRAS